MTPKRRRGAILSMLLLLVLVGASPFLVGAQPATPEAELAPEAELIAIGQEIYANVCAACHQPDGGGVDGIFPALAPNALVTLDDPRVVTLTVLAGRGGMPRFNAAYSDEQLAGVLTFIRAELGENDASTVSPAFVAEVRAEYDARAMPPVVEEATPEATPLPNQ